MALNRNVAQPLWQAERWGFSSKAERNLRDISHIALLVFAGVALAAGIVAGMSLSSNFGVGVSSSFILVAILFPLLCGLLAKELWHTKKLENRIKGQANTLGFVESALISRDNTPAGLLIVSPDLRILFANQKYLESALLEPEEVLGWKIQDVLSAEGVEYRASTLLGRSDPAASCCFNTRIRGGLAGERSVHITMARIAPRQGEDRVLVVVEDILQHRSSQAEQPLEGYVC